MTDNLVPFGKYRGQPVEVMLADRSYCECALAQPDIRERYPTFVTIVVNGGSAPDAPTPEHNRLQLLFRDPAMRVATIRSVLGEGQLNERILPWLRRNNLVERCGDVAALAVIDEEIAKGTFTPNEPLKRSGFKNRRYQDDVDWCWPEKLRDLFPSIWGTRGGWIGLEVGREAERRASAAARQAASRKLNEMLESGEARALFMNSLGEGLIEFEAKGWDVSMTALEERLLIELKPVMGDDYLAVLRTMKGRDGFGCRRVLIVDRFEADGATLDDVKWTFGQSRFAVRTLAEIRALMPART
jgi:hypothetical protein